MNREVGFEAIWKRCTNSLTDRQIKKDGKVAIRKIYELSGGDYKSGMAHVQCHLELTDVDKITDNSRKKVFEWVYFYRNAKKPNLIVTLVKKYLY